MKVLSITVPGDYEWNVGENCDEITGPYKDIYGGVYWQIVTEKSIYHEYKVYCIEYRKGDE